MPMLNFKTQFVEPIRAGVKHHTIRADRKVPVKPGDKLYLYCGARTKNCFRILPEAQTCTKVLSIRIAECGRCGGTGEVACSSTHYESCPVFEIHVDEVWLGRDECERLAVADGFKDFAAMMKFWDGRLPFKGQIIHWR